jgi:MFS family permease
MIAAHAAQFRWLAALSARAGGLRVVVANPDLKNLAMSSGAWVAGDWAFLITLSVLAYAEGGIPAVGIAGAARVLPAAAAAPWAAVVADRFPRPRVLAVIHIVWAVHVLVLAVAAYLHLAFLAICTIVAVGSALSAPFRPTVSSLMPQLVDKPQELTAGNTVFGTMEAAGTLLGPLAAGSLLLVLPPHLALLPLAVLYTLAARISLGIHTAFRPAREGRAERRGRTFSALVAGFSTLVVEPAARVIFVLFMAQATMLGLVNVFAVNAAMGMLGLGESGAGTLFSAIGVGGLAGAVLSFGLRPGGAARACLYFGNGLVGSGRSGDWGLAKPGWRPDFSSRAGTGQCD